jgi:hypothetical protein
MTMKRPDILSLMLLSGLALAGCGTASASGSAAKPSPSPSARVRNGAQGELVQIKGTTLVLNATAGDVTVSYDTTTTFVKTSTGTFADIVKGKCVVATGQKDAAGAVTASAVRLTDKVNGACSLGQGGPGGPGGGPGVGASPNPARSPRPNASPRPANLAFVAGEVTAVAGTTVTVNSATGGSQTVTVPTTVQVSRSAVAAATDLALHQCIAANGPRDAAGIVAARTVQIVPAGPSGCFTGTGRGFGGFGGARRGGGGGGAAGAPPGD